MGIATLIQIVAQLLRELLHSELLRLVEAVHIQGLPVVPPGKHRVKVLQLHGLGLGEVLIALGHIQPVEPGLLGGTGAVKEQDVRGDGGVGGEDAAGHADDGMEVKLRQELFLDVDLGVVGAEQKAVRQDDRRAPAFFQAVHDDGHEKVGGLGAGEVGGKMILDLGFFAAAVGGDSSG